MTHDDILAWARSGKMEVQVGAQQGLDLENMFPVTLINGPVGDPLAVAKSLFDEPQRKHEQSQTPDVLSTAYGFDDDQAILIVVVQPDDQTNWLHIMLYDTPDLYERGWDTQAPAAPAEPTKAELLEQIAALSQQVQAMPD